MIRKSIMAMIAAGNTSQDSRVENGLLPYDVTVCLLMRAQPDLNRSTASRLLNELLEIADPAGRTEKARSFAKARRP